MSVNFFTPVILTNIRIKDSKLIELSTGRQGDFNETFNFKNKIGFTVFENINGTKILHDFSQLTSNKNELKSNLKLFIDDHKKINDIINEYKYIYNR